MCFTHFVKQMGKYRLYLLLHAVVISCSRSFTSNADILIFGGNGFIGSECVSKLLAEGHNITLISRGSNIYDYEKRIKPHVLHISCDRYNGLHSCRELWDKIGVYDFIIDFSAYYPAVIEDAVQQLRGRFGTYIYISTDSVYEVSVPSNNRFSKESDAKRHQSAKKQEELNRRDMYGHLKLEGEEILIQQNKAFGLKYIILRLPDVIGPRDTTLRWWIYQTWFQFYAIQGHPMLLPKPLEHKTSSFVYVKDVATAIKKIIEDVMQGEERLLNNTFNLAFPEEITLRKLLDSMQQALNIQGVEYNYSDAPYYLYPSITRGPLNVSKAEAILKWETTPWKQVVQETTNFFKDALHHFPNERNRMMEKLQHLVKKQDYVIVLDRIENHILKSTEPETSHSEL